MQKDFSVSYPETINLQVSPYKEVQREKLYRFIRANNYEKVGPGIYISPYTLKDDLAILHQRCPKGVISHDAALYQHRLVDREPFTTTITIYSGYNASRLTASGYKVYYVQKDLLDLGKETVIDFMGNEVPMYDMERTIVDLFRNRTSFEIQDFLTAVRSYCAVPGKDLYKLHHYAKAFHVERSMQTYLEALIG